MPVEGGAGGGPWHPTQHVLPGKATLYPSTHLGEDAQTSQGGGRSAEAL